MFNKFVAVICIFLLILVSDIAVSAQTSLDGIWNELTDKALEEYKTEKSLSVIQTSDREKMPWIEPDKFMVFKLNREAFEKKLTEAPIEGLNLLLEKRPVPSLMTLPTPDGEYAIFKFVESSVMAPELAARFPEIKTYSGQSVDNPSISVRFDWTPQGFHAQVLAPGGRWYIDPYYRDDTETYVSYYKSDLSPKDKSFECLTEGESQDIKYFVPFFAAARSGDTLREYRLAVATTGEYAQFHGGTVPLTLAAIATTINRVTGIYESELAIRLTLIANNDNIIYTDPATDPFTGNSDPTILIGESQTEINSTISAANYDIGHTFSTGAGGFANLRVVCQDGTKATGVTGMAAPIGDPFDVDYVAHEIGHQFGANHPFNGSLSNCSGGNRNGPTAYEPGSGSTIMAYAGICAADNLQPNSDPIFHSVSHDEIIAYVTNGGSSCANTSSLGNAIPTANAGSDYTIPLDTPFVLTGSGSDADAGDVLTYIWEERDLGPQALLTALDDGQIPLFRVFEPTLTTERYFPRLETLVANTSDDAEKLPQLARTMDFRLTVRDGNGGVESDDMQITVDGSSGPFRVTYPNAFMELGDDIIVTWDVANSNLPPVNTANVNIYLSIDGGFTYDTASPLASATPNDGSETVTLPVINTNQARIMVKGDNNIFFDISNEDFAIVLADLSVTKSDSLDPAVAGEQLVYTVTVTNNGPGPSSGVRVEDVLPLGVTYQSDSAGCIESPLGTLTCDLGGLSAGDSIDITITVLIDADLVHNAGGPVIITNEASVENLDGPDPDPSNNNTSEDTLVEAVADLEIESFEAVNPPSESMVSEDVTITLQKFINNLGPSTPMDVQLTVTSSAAPGLTVSPSEIVLTETALSLNEHRLVEEVFTLRCLEASRHTYSFTNEIMSLSPDDTDPDLNNNDATLDLEIECVVPVAINIKPKSDPNSIQVRNKGLIPVAVLTTMAGEYGTPLDFDATTIDPLSVRFGPYNIVWLGGGGSEAHNRGHVKDSFELDETTKDGDLDMVLHFRTSETGITVGDTEACVKGEWLDAGGNRHKFFGCDFIRTIGR